MSDARPLNLPNASTAETALPPATLHTPRSLLQSYMILGKVRLNAMVVVTTALGFVMGSRQIDGFDFTRLLWTCLGTFIAAMGASGFNQALEARRDRQMLRTRKRPIPVGDLSATHACFFGLILCITGIAILCPTSNGLTAILGTLTVLLYVVVYTPMKRYSAGNTLVGAVVGGIPPMMGWTAATGALSPGAWILGTILFVWQMPHFLALAWMYRDDYARGGFKMVSTVEPTGRLTAILAVLYSLALIPSCLAMCFYGYTGTCFAICSSILGAGITLLALRFLWTRERADARRMFLASLLYLPLLCVVMIADSRGKYAGMIEGPAGYAAPSSDQFTDPGDLPSPTPFHTPVKPTPASTPVN